MDFMQPGQYGQTFECDADTPVDIIKEMMWDAAQHELGKFLLQGADRIEKIRLIVGDKCEAPSWNEDDEDSLGCNPRPHRHCGWKAVVVA